MKVQPFLAFKHLIVAGNMINC